jgi:stage II sporulation protein AA (anti-sigma F factor antagonist)
MTFRSLATEDAMMIAANPHLRMTQVERNGVVCLRPEGELDHGTTDELRDRLGELERLRKTVRLDLGGLTFLGTSGLGVLLDASARAREHGVRLTFYHGRPEVERMLQISGVDRLLSFEP